jgi:hypothetical protein
MSETNITVIDSIMGSGKTTHILKHLNDEYTSGSQNPFDDASNAKHYMTVTMYLEEAERFKDACPALEFIEPVAVGGKKLTHVNKLLAQGKNIASTHALFKSFTKETLSTLRETNYTLVIDEAVDVVHQYNITPANIRVLFASNMVYVDEKNRLCWNHRDWHGHDGVFVDVMNLCDNGHLVYVNDTVLMWELPVDFLEAFSEVIILTYLFEGSLMANFFKANGIPYTVKTLKDGEVTDVAHRDEGDIKAKLRDLITICEDKTLNAIGTPKGKSSPLCVSWYATKKAGDKASLERLKLNTENFFRHKVNGRSEDNMWTTFKNVTSFLKGSRYTKGFVPFNTKATNDHVEKKNLAYLVNVYVSPIVTNYLDKHGAKVDQDLFALSEMIQWVWRSQIRRGDPINLYVPSQRMRGLFLGWLNEGVQQDAEEPLAA